MKKKTAPVKQLNNKELAALLPKGPRGKHRTRGYVSAMRKAGFTGHTLKEARTWLTLHTSFTWASIYLPAHTRRSSRVGKTLPLLSGVSVEQ